MLIGVIMSDQIINQNQNIQQQEAKGTFRGVADIVFLIDVTASMQPALDGLKANLNKFVDLLDGKLTKDQTKIQWRARVIGYRDVEADGDNWWIENKFVDKVEELKNQISNLKADGGGDIPENTLDALLLAAKNTEWGDKKHKFIILFTDAPTKEKINKKNLEEGEKDDVNYLIQVLIAKRIKLILVAPKDRAGIYSILSAVPKSTVYFIGNEGESDVYSGLQNQNFDELLNLIAATISDSSSQPVVA